MIEETALTMEQRPGSTSFASVSDALVSAKEQYACHNPNSHALWQAATDSMPGGNTRTTLYFDPFPIFMASGEGCHLTDVDGHTYVDFLDEYTSGLYGHSNPVLASAIRSALDNGISLSSHNALEGKLARLICMRFESMDMVRFTNSGTEANVMALQNRHGILRAQENHGF